MIPWHKLTPLTQAVRLARRTLRAAERAGLIPADLKRLPLWERCKLTRRGAIARAHMLAAWVAGDTDAWARAVAEGEASVAGVQTDGA